MFKKIFDVLNTSLGIWLLSSVVLGGASFFYNHISSSNAENAKRQEATLRARLEVAQRLAQLVANFERIRRTTKQDEQRGIAEVSKLLSFAIQTPSQSSTDSSSMFFAAYPEFKDRPLLSMTTELLTIESAPGNLNSIRKLNEWTLKVVKGEYEGMNLKQISEAFRPIRIDPYWRLPEGK